MAIKKILLLLYLLLVITPSICFATDYYVRTDGNNANDGLGPGTDHAWATITYAESQLSNGAHTVHIAAGTYDEDVYINGISGTDENNRIVFVGAGSVYIDRITVGTYYNSGEANYITLSNLILGGDKNAIYNAIVTISWLSDYITVTGCTLDGLNMNGVQGIVMGGNHNLMTGCTLQNFLNSNMVDMGQQGCLEALGCNDSNTATLNVLKDGVKCDLFHLHGTNMTISYNTCTNFTAPYPEGNHPDFVQWYPNYDSGDPEGSCTGVKSIEHAIIEGNFVSNVWGQPFYGNNQCYTAGYTDIIVDDIVFRNNVFDTINFQGGNYGDLGQSNVKFYNNTFYKVGHTRWYYSDAESHGCTGWCSSSPDPYCSCSYSTGAFDLGSNITGIEVYNNIFLECGDMSGLYYTPSSIGWYSLPVSAVDDYNYAARGVEGAYAAKNATFQTANPGTGVYSGNPLFVTEGSNWHLQAGSPLIGAATPIGSFTTDKDGVIRGASWDIGAYEYTEGGSTPTATGLTIQGVQIQ